MKEKSESLFISSFLHNCKSSFLFYTSNVLIEEYVNIQGQFSADSKMNIIAKNSHETLIIKYSTQYTDRFTQHNYKLKKSKMIKLVRWVNFELLRLSFLSVFVWPLVNIAIITADFDDLNFTHSTWPWIFCGSQKV